MKKLLDLKIEIQDIEEKMRDRSSLIQKYKGELALLKTTKTKKYKQLMDAIR